MDQLLCLRLKSNRHSLPIDIRSSLLYGHKQIDYTNRKPDLQKAIPIIASISLLAAAAAIGWN